MSRNEFEKITIVLPSAEVAKLKKVLREKTNEAFEATKAEAVRLHKSFATKSVKLYAERLNKAKFAMYGEKQAIEDRYSGWGIMMVGTFGGGYRDPYAAQKARRDELIKPFTIRSLAFEVLEYVILRGAKVESWETRQPTPIHQPTTADVARVVPKLTNKDTRFDLFDYEGSIRIDGRKVTYHSGDGNHGAEQSRDSLLGKAFFAFLGQVAWTRGTGGFGIGNDEYNRDFDYVGGGGNYITDTWGPLGEKAQQDHMHGRYVDLGSDDWD